MIDFFFGRPRTGKTYRAVKIIHDEYLTEKSNPKFTYILTNIGGFKFDYVNQYFRDNGLKNQAFKLVWDDWYQHISKLHDMALEDKSDEELNRYAYSHKINDCLIIFDEAGLRMKRYDDAISWFLAYHGHFKVRLIFIAQGWKQINADYLVHTEVYYEAQKQSKQLRDNVLRYHHYDEIPFNKTNKFGSDSIKTSKKIYDLYKSGEIDKPKKMLYRFIAMMVFALLFMFGMYKLLMYRLSPDVPIDDNTTSIDTSLNSDEYNNISLDSSSFLLTIRCNDQYCWNADTRFNDTSISMNYVKYIVYNFKLQLQYSEVSEEIFYISHKSKVPARHTIAKLVDYTYICPLSLKKSYLARLFEKRQDDEERSTGFHLGGAGHDGANALVSDAVQSTVGGGA